MFSVYLTSWAFRGALNLSCVYLLFVNIPWSGLLFCARFTSFHTHASLLTFFVCLFVLFHTCCFHARVFGKTLLDEFPISNSHTEWYFIFSLYWVKKKLNMSSGHNYWHCSSSGRSNNFFIGYGLSASSTL